MQWPKTLKGLKGKQSVPHWGWPPSRDRPCHPRSVSTLLRDFTNGPRGSDGLFPVGIFLSAEAGLPTPSRGGVLKQNPAFHRSPNKLLRLPSHTCPAVWIPDGDVEGNRAAHRVAQQEQRRAERQVNLCGELFEIRNKMMEIGTGSILLAARPITLSVGQAL